MLEMHRFIYQFFKVNSRWSSRNCRSFISRRNSTSMKAVLLKEYGSPEVLRLNEVPKPTAENSEVLVKVHAAGINPVDVYIREGAFTKLPILPIILGKEAAGIIEEVGPNVKTFKVGDRVTCCLPNDGGYAEYVKCSEKYLIPLSTKLNFSQGATLYVAYFIAYRALNKCNIKKGETLFVHGGSGGVGIAAIQIAKSQGLTVIGTASTKQGLEIVKAAGADCVFNHREMDYLLKAYSVSGGKGFDVILENCADENLGKDFTVLARNGRIAVVGTKVPIKPSPNNPKVVPVNPRSLIFTEGIIHGISLIGVTEEQFDVTRKAIVTGIDDGWLLPIVGKQYLLSQASSAHKRLESMGACGKIVLNLNI